MQVNHFLFYLGEENTFELFYDVMQKQISVKELLFFMKELILGFFEMI
jgi:hypothetical protein